ncbi:MAG: LPS-assembly protein LptD [Candidatus Puniceispirillaceae bacterium]
MFPLSAFCKMMMRGIFILFAGLIFANNAMAQDTPVQFEADRVETNQERGTLIATGNVILIQNGNELRADSVEYNRTSQQSIAKGHVLYKTADGAIHSSDFLELNNEFTEIFAEPIISDMVDGSRFTAKKTIGNINEKLEMQSSSFTPCNCDYEAGQRPIWDLRATTTTHDVASKTVIHENVRMHIFGVPVFYLPVLAHPDWTVKRRSGFLAPLIKYSSSEGYTTSIPYYQTLGPSADIEFKPFIYQHRGKAVHTRYREKTDYSDLQLNLYTASVATYKKNRESVAAINLEHSTNVGDDWQINTKILRTSQDTFMRRYGFNNSYNYVSSVTAERLKEDRYYEVKASDFQGLRASDTPDKEPVILPSIYYEKISDGFRNNQKMRTELSAIQLDNDQGHELVRWSGDVGLYEDHNLFGASLRSEAGIMVNAYDIQKKTDDNKHQGEIGQANPYLSLDWRAPFGIVTEDQYILLEPRAKITHIAGADRTDEIPNRDSADFRLDENNLFLTHRHQGKDFVLPGTRADIGVSALAENSLLGDVTGFAGISRRLAGKTSAGLTTGNNRNYSDYVASITIKPSAELSISWSGRADSRNFELNESRTNLDWTYRSTKLSLEHASLAKAHFSAPTDDREALSATITQNLPDGWVAKASQTWDLSKDKVDPDNARVTLAWTGGFQDCLTLSLDYRRDAVSDRDIKRKDEFFLVLNFKYLGSISQNDLKSNN